MKNATAPLGVIVHRNGSHGFVMERAKNSPDAVVVEIIVARGHHRLGDIVVWSVS